MPGAPNKPPETAAPPAAAPAAGPDRARAVVRRLGPAHVALRLDVWHGAPHADLVRPVERAEALFQSGDLTNADVALDQFAVRLAEPRWPTLPEPFVRMRAVIVAPQPPHWDPDAKLAPEERQAKRLRAAAETQLALARATVETGPALGADLADLAPAVAAAAAALERDGPTEGFFSALDPVWAAVRERLPLPKPAPARVLGAAKLPAGVEPDAA